MTKKKGKAQTHGKTGIELDSGGFLKGLADVVDKLSELAQTGRELSKSGEFEIGPEKEMKGVYGFSLKVGLGGEKVRVEPFGNIRVNASAKKPVVVQEVREPAVDVLEEGDHILVVAEMPGIAASDVRLEVNDDVLTIAAERGDKKYRKEVLLPRKCPRERMTLSCNNGIVEIRCSMQ